MEKSVPTVLLVDDEESIREYARGVLERQGYNVLVAKNGIEALLLGEHHSGQIRALITDICMPPYMDGCELAQALRRARPGLAVLYISGYPPESVVQGEVLEEKAAFLSKPFTPEVLLRRLQEILKPASIETRFHDGKAREGKSNRSVLLLVPDFGLRSGIASLLRAEGLLVLEARNIGEALSLSQWHIGSIGLMLADKGTLASLSPEYSERLAQARPDMRILCATSVSASELTLSERVRRLLEEWGLEVAGEE